MGAGLTTAIKSEVLGTVHITALLCTLRCGSCLGFHLLMNNKVKQHDFLPTCVSAQCWQKKRILSSKMVQVKISGVLHSGVTVSEQVFVL